MKFQQQKGISPIIATLLLIAIAVAASIIVYVFVNSLAGGLTQGGGAQTTERLQMQSYNFALSPPANGGTACGCTGQVLEMFLLNSGSSSTSVSAVYFDGTLMTLSTPTTTNTALSGINNNAYTAPVGTTVNDLATTACTAGGSVAATICFTAPTTDTSYASGTVGQVVITFSAPVTAGTSHTVKVVSSTGATFVFAVTSGRSG
jgi:archaeal type IV pilus assembly protein PilA